MSLFARIQSGAVAELFTPPDGFSISDCFHDGLVWVEVTNVTPRPEPGWSATETSGGWTFSAPAPLVLSPEQQAAQELDTRIAAGISVTSTSTPTLNATYALDAVTLDQIGSVARDAAAGLGLPGGATTFSYPDSTGTPHALSGAQVQALYKAQRDLLFALNTQAAVVAHGGEPTWPAQTGTIP